MQNINNNFLGLAKTLFNSSVCLLSPEEVEIIQSERITRKKACGAWPEKAINTIKEKIDEHTIISENRDVISPPAFEDSLNSSIPFYSYLEKKNLTQFSQHFNDKLNFITHHLCHAYSTLPLSPFENSLIVVIDGAGSALTDFTKAKHKDPTFQAKGNLHEECSIYIQNSSEIKCIKKYWQEFKPSSHPGHDFSDGIGMFYEKIAEFIFNNKRSAGKVMGLAPFGKVQEEVSSPSTFLNSLDWSKSFSGISKKEWLESPNMTLFQNLAATVQNAFEVRVFSILEDIKKEYPHIDNLILTGGTALNCTNNMKVFNSGLFKNIYVPPFPSDEGISYGLAYASFYLENKNQPWKPCPADKQHGYLGPKSSIPTDSEVESVFKSYEVLKSNDIYLDAAKILNENNIIAWFQGRSESGPRALGNRSILASPLFPSLKDYLNSSIKFREDFRPYGCSIPKEYADVYFDLPKGFDNPYMSFASKIKTEYKGTLKEVSHIDGTSRKQTVSIDQNEKFYKLLTEFGNLSGVYCLLNTSLNTMGEPIVETLGDLKHFFDKSEIRYAVVNDYIIKKS